MPREDETRIMSFLVGLHHDLLGAWGSWIVSISGLLLCSNLLLGLIAAWPRRGTWRTALLPIRKGPAAARLRSDERRVGKECVRTCRSRGSPDHKQKTKDNRSAKIHE